MAIHRYHAKTYYGTGSHLYNEMRSTGIKKWKYDILEEYEYENISDLRSREEHYRSQYLCDDLLNMNRAVRTKDDINKYARDYYHEKGHIRLKKKYQENKEEILKRQKEYYKQNKEKFKLYYDKIKDDPEYKERQKQYREKYKAMKQPKKHENQKTILEFVDNNDGEFDPFD